MVDLPGPVPLRGTAASPRAQAKPAISSTPKVASDVAGKSLPQLVELANELASGPPPLDYARIAQIRAAISTGTYRIDPERIAQALTGKGR
ncbi:hypothetical protein GCM10022276_11670 [Sphingomonas limnosediminicola]|jgi:negative regulator of flagellin synthesis FlgM|uniref:Negative regulator of flagellin synthesis n=1 Tax=Sphingomonas limnosediminicola TaxID=940133 RepID=A0ABP7L338_9SPHN